MAAVTSDSSQFHCCSMISIPTINPFHGQNSPASDDVKQETQKRSNALKKSNSFLKRAFDGLCKIFKKLGPFSAVLAIIIIVVASIMSIAVGLVLMALILMLRMFQLTSRGKYYDHVTICKGFLRLWMWLNIVLVLFLLGMLYPIAKYVPCFKNVVVIGVTLTDWIKIGSMFCGLYFLNCFLSLMALLALRSILTIDLSLNGRETEIWEVMSEVMSCLIFWWGEIETMKHVSPEFNPPIFGIEAQKWIQVPTFIFLGYNITRFTTYVTVWLLWKVYQNLEPKETKMELSNFLEFVLFKNIVVYCAYGMRRSINFVFNSVLLLLIWLLYFVSHLNGSRTVESVVDFVARTCASLLVMSLLWWVKSCILLSWEAHSLYTNDNAKNIVEVGQQLYFLGILGRKSYDLFWIENCVENNWKIRTLKNHLFHKKGHEGCSLFDLYLVAQHLLNCRTTFLDESYTSTVLGGLKSDVTIDKQKLKKILDWDLSKKKQKKNKEESNSEQKKSDKETQDWKHFKSLLRKARSSTQPSSLNVGEDAKPSTSANSTPTHEEQDTAGMRLDDIKTWVEGARKSCLLLANRISSAMEVQDCLNRIMIALVTAASLLMWLLLTGLATTQILVLVASPLLAATFIFGDTCKSLFQGIMFVYVMNPISIGDLCVIDGQMMEVSTIGVWKTTFLKVCTQGEVIYSNTELINKVIVNHKTDFDWEDNLEFEVSSLDDEKINAIRVLVEEQSERDSHNVNLLATGGDKWKLGIRFRHINSSKSLTHSESAKQKEDLRSKLSLQIQKIVNLNHSTNSGSKLWRDNPCC